MTKAKIVVVEDDRIVARDIAQQLTRIGHTVVGTTGRGEEALALTLATKPNLVLMDIRLGGEVDGIDAAAQIRARFSVPVIFLTAYADDPTVQRASQAEPYGYLIKPFEDSQLRTTIEMALYKHAAEQRLRESERRYAVTLSSIGDAVIATDRDGNVTFMNPVAEALTGWTKLDAVGQPLARVFRIVNEATRLPVEDPAAKVLRLGTVVGLANHTVLLSRDGRESAIDDSGAPIFDDDGVITGVVLVFRDITQRRQAEEAELLRLSNARLELDLRERIKLEEALRASEERYRNTFENAPVSLVHTDLENFSVLHVNQTYVDLTGWSREELLGLGGMAIIHPDDRQERSERFVALLSGSISSYATQLRIFHKSGKILWVHLTVCVSRDAPDGQPYLIIVLEDVTERLELESELKVAKDAAEASNRAKDEFLANVSHEIRTPMNAILGMTELVLDTSLEEAQRQSLRTVKSAAESLLAIINDVLDFSKIEAGKMELDPTEFRLRALLGDTMQALAVRAQRKGLELSWHVAPDAPDVLVGDAGRLRQVLINLVGNAIKFTALGYVRVEVVCVVRTAAEVELRFAVQDTGIGIPKERQESIFRAFEQEDMSTTRRYGGTGLGLTIAARFVEMMDGTITVESTPNSGSTFAFALRIPWRENPSVQALQSEENPAPSASEGSERAMAPLRVLVAEDNPFNSQLLLQLLSSRGHSVRVAYDGASALDHARSGGFDLLLLDLHMPKLDGFQVIEALREHERVVGGHLVTIALTARSRKEDRERCLAAGMDGFLAKPIHAATLWAALERIGSSPHAALGSTMPLPLPADPLVTASVLLATCGGDPVVLDAIRNGLRTHLPEMLGAMDLAFQERDAPRVREIAHSMSGMLAAFSTRAGDIASIIEDVVETGEIEGAGELIEQLRGLAPALYDELDGVTIESLMAPMQPR